MPGLRFARLLGCARGRSFGWRPDLRRWGLVAVWESAEALESFLATSRVAARLLGGDEAWTAQLEPLASRGHWDGESPFGDAPGRAERSESDGPVVVLTRASLRASRLRQFRRAVPAVDLELARAPGLLASVGVGESPLRRQGTVSVWRSVADLRAFAYAEPAHLEAIRRRQAERWYAEELFARFRPLASTGTWDGVDPLAAVRP